MDNCGFDVTLKAKNTNFVTKSKDEIYDRK